MPFDIQLRHPYIVSYKEWLHFTFIQGSPMARKCTQRMCIYGGD